MAQNNDSMTLAIGGFLIEIETQISKLITILHIAKLFYIIKITKLHVISLLI